MALPEKKAGFLDADSMVLFKRSIGYFRPYMAAIVVATLAMIFAGLCDAGTAWLVKPALDDIFIKKDPTALMLIPIGFTVLTLIKGGTRILQNYLMQYSGLKVLETLRDELYRKIIKLPLRFYEGSQVGMLMSRIINDVVAIRSSLPAVVMMIRQVITLIALLGVVFYQNFELALWAIIVLPGAFFPFVYFSKRIRRLSRENQEQLGGVSVILQEILSGIRVVKAFSMEDQEGDRFTKGNKRLLRIALKQSIAGEFSSGAMDLVGAVGIAFVLWFGGMQVIEGQSTPGTFFSFVAALVMLYEPVKKLSASNLTLQGALAGAERVFAILDDAGLEVEKGGDIVLDEPFQELRFEHVSFAYADNTPVLNDVSFTIRAGERIAIVGPSGAGKTTFVNLIPRFYEPRKGRILLNGRPLADYTLDSLRHNISLVSQDNFLFNFSVLDNITYGFSSAGKEAAVAAAKSAYAHDFIESMPEGYDSVIGERGVKLSGGQKQRLTIARALVKNAPLLILDEATSALDSESEQIVQKALENLMEHRTSIVIAHRLSTVIGADCILVMENGKIVASGTHDELLKTSPTYEKLYTIQFATPDQEAPPDAALPHPTPAL